MIIKLETIKEYNERTSKWHEWYAWYPYMCDGVIYWLELIEVRRECVFAGRIGMPSIYVWHARRKAPEHRD